MSIETLIFSALSSLVDGRVYPDIAPESTPGPYITYQQVGGRSVNFLDSTSASKKNARVQINVWADTRLAASDVGRSVEDALRTALHATALGALVALYEEETKRYGTRQDFSIWS